MAEIMAEDFMQIETGDEGIMGLGAQMRKMLPEVPGHVSPVRPVGHKPGEPAPVQAAGLPGGVGAFRANPPGNESAARKVPGF